MALHISIFCLCSLLFIFIFLPTVLYLQDGECLAVGIVNIPVSIYVLVAGKKRV